MPQLILYLLLGILLLIMEKHNVLFKVKIVVINS